MPKKVETQVISSRFLRVFSSSYFRLPVYVYSLFVIAIDMRAFNSLIFCCCFLAIVRSNNDYYFFIND